MGYSCCGRCLRRRQQGNIGPGSGYRFPGGRRICRSPPGCGRRFAAGRSTGSDHGVFTASKPDEEVQHRIPGGSGQAKRRAVNKYGDVPGGQCPGQCPHFRGRERGGVMGALGHAAILPKIAGIRCMRPLRTPPAPAALTGGAEARRIDSSCPGANRL